MDTVNLLTLNETYGEWFLWHRYNVTQDTKMIFS